VILDMLLFAIVTICDHIEDMMRFSF